MVMFQSNYIGESEASQIINTNTVGDKPLPPRQDSFIIVNSTLAILRLDQWQQMSCPILYFVIEYKLRSESTWTVGKFCQTNIPAAAIQLEKFSAESAPFEWLIFVFQ